MGEKLRDDGSELGNVIRKVATNGSSSNADPIVTGLGLNG
jgi:hypothetical protein